MKKIFLFIVLGLIGLGVIILIIYKNQNVGDKTLLVKQVGAVNIKIEKDTLIVRFNLEIENTSFIDIFVDSVNISTHFQEKQVFKKENLIQENFESYSKDTLSFELKIPYVELMKDLSAEKQNNDSAYFFVSGYLKYSTLFGSGIYNLNKTLALKIPQPPEIKIVEVDWDKIRLKKLAATITLEINNFNDLSFITDSLNYSMKIHNLGSFKGKYNQKIKINNKGKTWVNIPITISIKGLGKTIKDIFKNEDFYDYTLKMDFHISSKELSEDQYFIEIVKEGNLELKK